MYSSLAKDWVVDGFVAHYISLFPNDVDALKAYHWMGFSMFSVDAVRGLDPIPGGTPNVNIRRAEIHDLEPVMELHEALRGYMKESPIFFLSEKRDHSYYEAWLQDPNKVVWLAYRDGEPVAFMRLGPANDDVSTIIYDQKTTSIYSAFTKEEAREGGIATALLNYALESARHSGYERCAVDFEAMNLLGAHFWLKYFKPVSYSVFRFIDDRVTHVSTR
jgi:GNAT superfamily N-acetyltransferase